MSAVRVYRLDVTYPAGSDEPGWEPAGWEPGGYQIDDAGSWETGEFRWPRERVYLSRKGADYKAGLLRGYGAQVTVVPSLPVEWPAASGGAS